MSNLITILILISLILGFTYLSCDNNKKERAFFGLKTRELNRKIPRKNISLQPILNMEKKR